MARRGVRCGAAAAVSTLLLLGCRPDPAGTDGPTADPERTPAMQAPPGTEDAAEEAGGVAPPPGERAPEIAPP